MNNWQKNTESWIYSLPLNYSFLCANPIKSCALSDPTADALHAGHFALY